MLQKLKTELKNLQRNTYTIALSKGSIFDQKAMRNKSAKLRRPCH